ncbi:MAG: hypothetical protein AAB879_01370 [Patescibacteria group bacterium]
MTELIPAILAKDEATFRSRLAIAEMLASIVQLDIMDGHFVPNATWYDPAALKTIKTNARYELHLMVSDPTAYIGASEHMTNIARIIWHIEVAIAHDVLINWCHTMGIEAGIAISPETPIGRLDPFVADLDEILVLGVHPGFSGQALQPHTREKVKDVRVRWPNVVVGFDGGVNVESIRELRDAGVTRFCVASAIFQAQNPKKAFKELSAILESL